MQMDCRRMETFRIFRGHVLLLNICHIGDSDEIVNPLVVFFASSGFPCRTTSNSPGSFIQTVAVPSIFPLHSFTHFIKGSIHHKVVHETDVKIMELHFQRFSGGEAAILEIYNRFL